MTSIAEKLTLANNTKKNIKQALIDKNIQVLDTYNFNDYAELINNNLPLINDTPLTQYTKTTDDIDDKLGLLQNTKNNIKTALKNKGANVPDTLAFSGYPELIKNTLYNKAQISLVPTQTSGAYHQIDIMEGKGSTSVVCGTNFTLNNDMDLFIMDLDTGEIEFEGKAKLTAEQPYIPLMKVRYESIGGTIHNCYLAGASTSGLSNTCAYVMIDRATNKPLSLETGYTYKIYPQNNFITLRSDATTFPSGKKSFQYKTASGKPYQNLLALEESSISSDLIEEQTFNMSGAITTTSIYEDIRLPPRIIEDIKNGKYIKMSKGCPVIYKGASTFTLFLGSAVDINSDILKWL